MRVLWLHVRSPSTLCLSGCCELNEKEKQVEARLLSLMDSARKDEVLSDRELKIMSGLLYPKPALSPKLTRK